MNKKQETQADFPAASSEAPGAHDLPWELPRYRNWIAVARVNQIVRRAMGEGLASVGLDLPHYEVLAAVFRYPGLTQQELADKLLVGRSNLSMLLPDMERRCLIDRRPDAEDRRLRRLFLTPEGEAQAREGLAIQVRLIEHMMGSLSAQECEQIGEMMRRVGKFLAEKPFRP